MEQPKVFPIDFQERRGSFIITRLANQKQFLDWQKTPDFPPFKPGDFIELSEGIFQLDEQLMPKFCEELNFQAFSFFEWLRLIWIAICIIFEK